MNLNTPSILFTPRRAAIPAGFESTLEVLVHIAAPEAPATAAPPRAPLHLAIVIDRSGSMSGEPLEEAKKAAAFIVESLSPQDRASLVVFDNGVDLLVPLVEMGQRSTLLAAIRGVETGGSTNLHGGWLTGAESLASSARPNVLSRVILLSDGCTNHGLQDTAAIAHQCSELAGTGVSTSTYGLGRGFNETLMIEMARAGQGNNYYGETAADLMDPFREEFALLNALCARQTVLQVQPANGVRVKLLNDYAVPPSGGWRLPNLAYGAEAWAMLRLTIPATAESVSPGELFTATLSYQSLTGETCAPISGTLALPAVSQALFGTLAEDVLVLRRLGELDAAKLQEQARSAAKRQDWAQVDMLLGEVSKLGADNPWVAGIVKELKKLASRRDDVLFQKEAAYSSNRMRGRMTAVNESADIDAAVPAFLRRKMAQGKAEPDPAPSQ